MNSFHKYQHDAFYSEMVLARRATRRVAVLHARSATQPEPFLSRTRRERAIWALRVVAPLAQGATLCVATTPSAASQIDRSHTLLWEK